MGGADDQSSSGLNLIEIRIIRKRAPAISN